MERRINVEAAEKLIPLITTKKRIKIAVGGRGGSKSICFADCFAKFCDDGERLLCAREWQNSIDDSVHSLIKSRIDHHDVKTLVSGAKSITSTNGGEIIYKGLARDPEAIKSLFGVNRAWVEEAATLSQKTIDTLLPTLREADSEIWFSLNRGSSNDPFSKTFLEPYEEILERDGYYEDEDILIIEINYYDNPWFPEVLEKQRLADKKRLPRAQYDHIWLGKYSDTIDNAIILPEWFDAAVDAHKIPRLAKAFTPHGAKIASHDPSDEGDDAKAYALKHGSIIKRVLENDKDDIADGCDWATDQAIADQADWFVWDGDGMGAGLKRQVSTAFKHTRVKYHMFRGSLSGKGQDNAGKVFDPMDGDKDTKPKKYEETFKNNRAQYYMGGLSRRFYNVYRCVEKGDYMDPDDMISIESEGVENINSLRSQLCRIPRKSNGTGLNQVMSKKEMLALGIPSPNSADAVMMTMFEPPIKQLDSNDAYNVPTAYSAFG